MDNKILLVGDVGLQCRELLWEIAQSKEMLIYAGSINHGYVHMLTRIPPQVSASRAVQYLKGRAHTNCYQSISICVRGTEASTYGQEVIGWLRAGI